MSSAAEDETWSALRRLPMGQRVEIRRHEGQRWVGTLVPPHELSGDHVVQLKLDNGYNIGIALRAGDTFVVAPLATDDAGTLRRRTEIAPRAVASADVPWVALLTTGGTIASRVDYQTGGVRPVRDENEILSFYPDLERGGPVRVVPVFDRLSEDIAPDDWVLLARRVMEVFDAGARGVVVAHGTDTMAFTASALSFLFDELPGPVVLVGAQRSPDRPSSDGFTNIAAAVDLARAGGFGEVVVVMHAGLSDDRFAIHRGTRVRKMHASRRDAFESRNGPPLGEIDAAGVHWRSTPRAIARWTSPPDLRLNPHATLLWCHPGLTPERASAFAHDVRGLVLAGTGLGHVSAAHLPWIREAVDRGVVVVMTTQCLEGDVDPYVYSTGRELLKAGVLYARDMLPETAYVKLLWALARSDDPAAVGRSMLADRAGEFEPRHQAGGVP